MEHNATDKLDEFLKSNDKYENVETARQRTNAMIPTARPLKTAVKRNVALIGDSGHHCDPFHGGGMMFGSRAGKAFGEAIAKDDLQLYDQIWQDDFLDTLQNRFVLKDLVYSMDNGEYDRFVDAVTGFDVTGVNPDVQIPRMMWHILKSDPGIFTKSAADATRGFMKHKIGI